MAASGPLFLAGDIGGTRLRLRLAEILGSAWQARQESDWPSRRFDTLEAGLQAFLDRLPRADRDRLCGGWLAVAGPVAENRVHFTNLGWQSDGKTLARQLGLPRIELVNDLVALAHTIPALDPGELVEIRPGKPDKGCGLLVSAGTGLGVAIWKQGNDALQVWPSEGGHSDFAPLDEWQFNLLRWLQVRHDHVSYERLASGPGLVALYDFLHEQAAIDPGSGSEGDRAVEIVRLAVSGSDQRARQAVDHFARIFGAFCGNAALHTMATAGVYVAGGVGRALHARLEEETFGRAFTGKGRMADLLNRVPVYGIRAAEPGLDGISHLAFKQIVSADQ